MSYEQLRDEILAKKPVIHTRFAEQLITEPQDVENSYNYHYHTHIPLGDIDNYSRQLIGRVKDSKTSKGAVVAPWGYGKTSTLIFIWKICEDAGILTVPPFICSSLQDILNATYGWLRFRLGRTYYDELESVYNQYGQEAFEDRVKNYSRQTGVPEPDARVVLRSAMSDGSFTPELTPSNLMKFIEYGTELAARAGFQGLIILIDELQEFFGKSADMRGTIQKLREIVWWLAAHGKLPLSMILCMQDGTEAIIQEDGQDILDRLKTDRLYISLRNIYNPEFPRLLWERYVEVYNAEDEAKSVLDLHLLTSTGQIATREDLGRGPRTVIDIFQCALRHFDKTEETYTPIILIDDFLNGQISFDMQTNPIRFAVEDALTLLKNQISSEAHQRAIKLWAAFPEHGCPDDVLETYGAKEAAYELSEMHGVHGPLLTYQSVGYTLRKLASFTPGGTAVERIARDFWLAYKESDPKWAEASHIAFIKHILPRIFEKRSKAWGNWDLQHNSAKGFGGRLYGSFSDQYPDRVLDLQVATEPTRIEPRRADARSDFQFDFVLQPNFGTDTNRGPGRIEFIADNPRWIRFKLNLGDRTLAGANLPQDLRNLKSSIHPNFLTPQLMLAFVDYAERWEDLKPENRILESERGPVTTILESMINYSVRVLFNEELKATFYQKLNFTGLQVIREIFVLACQTAWPPDKYHPLLSISERAFDDYLDALTRLLLREKRGNVPLSEKQKGKLSLLFGIDSHKTFENRAKSDYSHLMDYRDLGGDQAQVQLRLHPLETAILQETEKSSIRYRVGERDVPALDGIRLLNLADQSGYRDKEAAMALKLLVARELVGKDDQDGLIYCIPAGPSPQEVDRGLKKLLANIHGLPTDLVKDREKEPLARRIEHLRERFSLDLDEEALEILAIEMGKIESDLSNLTNLKYQSIQEELDQLAQSVHQQIGVLNRFTELEEDVPAGLDFRRHLMDFQETLKKKVRNLVHDLNAIHERIRNSSNRPADELSIDALPAYHMAYTEIISKLDQLNNRFDGVTQERQGLVSWFKLLQESELLYKSLSNMDDLRSRLIDEVVGEIKRNFTRRGLDALAEDSEHYRGQFDEIIRERDTRVAAGHEAFGEMKEKYRRWLSEMGVERSDFPARYSPIEHEQSYQDMFEQIRLLAVGHLILLKERLGSLDLDLRKAHLIHLQKFDENERSILNDLDKQRFELQEDLESVNQWLTNVDLTQSEDLVAKEKIVKGIAVALDEVDNKIRRLILRPISPQTPEEKKVHSLLGSRREADLTELVLSAGEELDLPRLMDGLLGLYQGNQISVKIQKRG